MIEGLEGRVLMASPHFVSGPEYAVSGLTLTATGSVAGLGNQDVTVTLNATGTATIQGRNPAGHLAPGQTKEVNLSGQQKIDDPKNGRVDFSVTTQPPVAPQLPNKKWTAVVTNVDFTSATLTVEQGGDVVLTDATTDV
jgi:hypothetical protein